MLGSAPTLVNGAWGYGIIDGDFASYDSTLGIIPLSATGALYTRAAQVEGATATDNVLVSSPQNQLTMSTSINSLKIASGDNIDLGANALEITRGGIIKSGTASSITGGQIVLTTAAAALRVDNQTDLTIGSDVNFKWTAGSSGFYDIIKAGAGKLTLTGSLLGNGAVISGTTTGSTNAWAYIGWHGGDLEVDTPSATLISLSSTTCGKLTKGGEGTMVVAPPVYNGIAYVTLPPAWTGGTEVNGGILWVGHPLSNGASSGNVDLGNTVVNSGTLYATRPLVAPITMNGGALHVYQVQNTAVGLTATSTVTVPTGKTAHFYGDNSQTGYWDLIYGLDGGGTLTIQGKYYSAAQLTAQTAASDGFTGTLQVMPGYTIQTANNVGLPQNGTVLLMSATSILKFGQTSSTPPSTPLNIGTIAGSGRITGWDQWHWTTIQGGEIRPQGATAADAGILTITGASFATTSSVPTKLTIGLLHSAGTTGGFAPTAGVDYDQLAVGNSNLTSYNTLAGVDLVVNIAAKQNYMGQVFTVVTSALNNLTGQSFHSIGFNGTGFADVALSGTTVGPKGWVTVSNIYYPGDANRDGITDMSDYIIWFNNFGQTSAPGLTAANWQKADFNGDGITDMTDYIAWFNYFGDDQGSFGVPEPATLALIALGLPLVRRRRR